MKNNQQDEGWMDYLRERPGEAKELIREAQRQDIAAIKEKYRDVITAYNRTRFKLHGLVADAIKLDERQQAEGRSVELSKALQQTHEDGEKEWNRLSEEFHLAHGSRYDAYKRAVADIKARYRKLRALLVS